MPCSGTTSAAGLVTVNVSATDDPSATDGIANELLIVGGATTSRTTEPVLPLSPVPPLVEEHGHGAVLWPVARPRHTELNDASVAGRRDRPARQTDRCGTGRRGGGAATSISEAVRRRHDQSGGKIVGEREAVQAYFVRREGGDRERHLRSPVEWYIDRRKHLLDGRRGHDVERRGVAGRAGAALGRAYLAGLVALGPGRRPGHVD
jgi:hypothetical protein